MRSVLTPFRLLFAVILLIAVGKAAAQQSDVPLQRDFYIDVERNASHLDARIQTGLKPIMESRADLTNVMGHRVDSTKYYWPGLEKLFSEHLIIVDDGEVHITIDPLFRFELGKDYGDLTLFGDTNNPYVNARGVRIQADLGPKFSVQTMLHEVQAIVPQYLFATARDLGVMPGEGRVKLRDNRSIDYGWAQGHVSYSPSDWFNVQFGHGRHFVGHGYRSVLLSDHAPPAPFLKFNLMSRSGRVQYSTWHTKLTQGLRQEDRLPTGNSAESLFYWRRARFNHIGLLLGRFELGLFESTIYRNIDGGRVRPLDLIELVPVFGVNTLVNGFDGPYKTTVGMDLRVKVLDKVYVYGQFGTDRPDRDRYAWQAGLRIFDLVRRDIHLQVEYNAAQPFMYQFGTPRLAYMHGGLPLAHPLGSYFNEWVAILDAGFGRVIGQAKVNLATVRFDRSAEENHGIDLYKPQQPVLSPLGPLVRDLTFLDLNASYLINPVTNLRFTAGVRRRDLPGRSDREQSTYVYVALATNVFNRYHDL